MVTVVLPTGREPPCYDDMQAESKGDVAKMIQLQSPIKFNGGGHVNHSIFWTNLAPPKARTCRAVLLAGHAVKLGGPSRIGRCSRASFTWANNTIFTW